MTEGVVKLPFLNLEIPKPKPWDLIALAAVVVGLAAAVANLLMAGMRQPPGDRHAEEPAPDYRPSLGLGHCAARLSTSTTTPPVAP